MNNPPAKIIFFGTDEFAVIVLDALLEAHLDIIAVVTTPDEVVGRKKLLTSSPVKLAAKRHSLPLLQPTSLRGLKLPDAELGILVVYGKLIPGRILNHFPLGILNIHPSLLPAYRGPSPIRTAIFNGDAETGVSIIKLNTKMDEGPVITLATAPIDPHEHHDQLRDKLAQLGAGLLISTLPEYLADHITPQPQDNAKASYTRLLTRDDGRIDWTKSGKEIYNQFRALEGWPGIWFLHAGKRVKILDCKMVDEKLVITTLQPEGKKAMSLKDFENGYGVVLETKTISHS